MYEAVRAFSPQTIIVINFYGTKVKYELDAVECLCDSLPRIFGTQPWIDICAGKRKREIVCFHFNVIHDMQREPF